MPTPVTDPNVLAQLEGGGGGTAPGGRPVTDPKLLAQLEGGGDQRSFLEHLGSFARKVYENPPPTVAGARDIIKAAPAAAQELTWGADPQAAEQAAGTVTQAAGMGLGFRGLGGTGVAARPIARPGTVPWPTLPPLFPREAAPATSVSQQAVEAAGRGGYTLPSYVATEGTVIPQVASSLKNVPWGGQPIVRSHDELLAAMGRSAGEIAPAAGTPETAGARAKTGLTSFIETGSQKPVSEAYKAVDALIDPEVRVPLTNTAELAKQIMADRANARIPGSSKAVDIVSGAVAQPEVNIGGKPASPELLARLAKSNPDLVQQPGMNYKGTKELRSYLGERTPQQLIAEGINPIEAKRIYGALTKDLGNVVRAAGGDTAFTAWHQANRLASLTKAQQNALTKITGAAGDAAPEAVFNRLVTFANSKAGGDLNRLQLARKAMGPEAWGAVGSALIDRLGKAPDGSFSPQRFVTAFGNMAPAARNEVFSGQQHAALADLFTVSKHIQDRITRFGNPSGTARGSILGQAITGGALWTEPVHTLTAMVGARLAAEALSRPAVVRAATQAARASLTGNPVVSARALAVLRAVATREGLISATPPQNSPAVRAEATRPFEAAVRGDLQQQFPNESPAQIDRRVAAVTEAMTTNAQRQEFLPEIHAGLRINQPNWERFLAAQPRSTNIEDRRGQLPAQLFRR